MIALKQLTNADVVILLWKGKLTAALSRLRPPFSVAKTAPVVTPAVPPNNK
jgi:hypothetical protein